jgi:hypothetical protein
LIVSTARKEQILKDHQDIDPLDRLHTCDTRDMREQLELESHARTTVKNNLSQYITARKGQTLEDCIAVMGQLS